MEAKMEVLPEADGFSTETISISAGDVEYYAATNGAGYVFNTSYKGYGGRCWRYDRYLCRWRDYRR